MNRLNDGPYYVNINFNVCHNNNLFHIYIYNHLFELAREREKVARACAPASARLSLQAMTLSYFKNSDFTPSLQRNTVVVSNEVQLLRYCT